MEVFEVYIELAHAATKEIVRGQLESVALNTSSSSFSYQKTGRKHTPLLGA